jgi:hypothetical protein
MKKVNLPQFTQDATFRPAPSGGWPSVLLSLNQTSSQNQTMLELIQNARYLQGAQLRPWYMTTQPGNLNLGSNTKKDPVSADAFLLAGSNVTFTPANANLGILDTIEPRFYIDASLNALGVVEIKGLQQVPFYESASAEARSTSLAIAEKIEAAILKIQLVDKGALLGGSEDEAELFAYYTEINELLREVPYGISSL